ARLGAAGGAPEHATFIVEDARSLREGPSASERFERRAEEIARAAEVGEETLVLDEPDLLAAAVEQELPQVGDERRLAGPDSIEQTRRERANACVEEGTAPRGPEARDAVPFGLKRRVPVGMPVFGHQERRASARIVVSPDETREVRGDGGIGVHHEKVAAAEE